MLVLHNRGTVNGDATYGGGAKDCSLHFTRNYCVKTHATYGRAIYVTDRLLYFICYKITKQYSTSWAESVRWY